MKNARYTLSLSEEQLRVVQTALDLNGLNCIRLIGETKIDPASPFKGIEMLEYFVGKLRLNESLKVTLSEMGKRRPIPEELACRTRAGKSESC